MQHSMYLKKVCVSGILVLAWEKHHPSEGAKVAPYLQTLTWLGASNVAITLEEKDVCKE
jgi:hypothetical protein